jgi:hypothetical protein
MTGDLPKVVVEAEPRYLIGFPLVVAMTYENDSTTAYATLPALDFDSNYDGRVGVHLVPVRGGVAVQPSVHEHGEFRRKELLLPPGAAFRTLIDITRESRIWEPGVYELSLSVLYISKNLESAPVTVELVTPSAADAQEAARLRGLGNHSYDANQGSWYPFLARNPGTVAVSPALSVEASQQLALYLFHHRAAYGPETPAQIDARRLDAIVAPSLRAEVAALELELAAARLDPSAPALEKGLVARWPGMAQRAADIRAGNGAIARAREGFGAGSHFAPRFPQRAYSP